MKECDYDFIGSESFQGIAFVERMSPFQSLWKEKPLLETLCYNTPKEFKIKKKQIEIDSTTMTEAIKLA